jgi:hypothetical protein
MPLPQYGSTDGLPDRLLEWVDRLGRDKHFPWVGTGLLADLKTAAAELIRDPRRTQPVPDKIAKKILEFDL